MVDLGSCVTAAICHGRFKWQDPELSPHSGGLNGEWEKLTPEIVSEHFRVFFFSACNLGYIADRNATTCLLHFVNPEALQKRSVLRKRTTHYTTAPHSIPSMTSALRYPVASCLSCTRNAAHELPVCPSWYSSCHSQYNFYNRYDNQVQRYDTIDRWPGCKNCTVNGNQS